MATDRLLSYRERDTWSLILLA